jgi:hypothetical protein
VIPVDDFDLDAGEFEVIETEGGPEVIVSHDLTDEDAAKLDFLDAEADERARVCRHGDLFILSVERRLASDQVVAAFKRSWEAGGWIVGAVPVENGYHIIVVRPRLHAMRPVSMVERALDARGEQVVESVTTSRCSAKAPKMSQPLLVRMPTRGRPEQALRVLGLYRSMAETAVPIEVIIDYDDVTMNNAVVLQRLYDLDCLIFVGAHKSKIEACNSGRIDDWQILVLASDDMVPVKRGYDTKIVEHMRAHFPLFDGALCFDDGYNKSHSHNQPGKPILCTLPVMGRHLHDAFGYVYDPRFRSICCDNAATEIQTAMNRMVFVDELLIEHRHHAAGKASVDALYKHNDGKWSEHDHRVFRELADTRQPGSQFMFDAPEMVLSILVCSTYARAKQLGKLVDYLRAQMREYPREVELVVEIDGGGMKVGEKRQRLLERAVGTYVAFVDDDDWVAHDYVRRIVTALRATPGADCCSLEGVLVENGGTPQRFTHSVKWDGWYTKDQVHYRTPNHLSCIRLDHALAVGFVAKDVGEDHEFSTKVRSLLKIEADTGPAPLYYYWFNAKSSVQARS